jgi:hypothetical protein
MENTSCTVFGTGKRWITDDTRCLVITSRIAKCDRGAFVGDVNRSCGRMLLTIATRNDPRGQLFLIK